MSRLHKALVATAIIVGVTAAAASAMQLSAWARRRRSTRSPATARSSTRRRPDGCPIQSPDGLSLYMASNRPGGKGGLDIWVATRATTSAPWGAPQNLGEPVNSAADDFCPTPVGKRGLFFVSREALPGSVRTGRHLLHPPQRSGRLGGARAAPLLPGRARTAALDEQGPSWVDVSTTLRGQKHLYFSRSSVTRASRARSS